MKSHIQIILVVFLVEFEKKSKGKKNKKKTTTKTNSTQRLFCNRRKGTTQRTPVIKFRPSKSGPLFIIQGLLKKVSLDEDN